MKNLQYAIDLLNYKTKDVKLYLDEPFQHLLELPVDEINKQHLYEAIHNYDSSIMMRCNDAMAFLAKHDSILRESVNLLIDLGYELYQCDSTLLATLLYRHMQREEAYQAIEALMRVIEQIIDEADEDLS